MEGLSFKKLSLLSPLSDLLRFHKNKSFGCGVHSPSTLFFILLQLNHEQVSTNVHPCTSPLCSCKVQEESNEGDFKSFYDRRRNELKAANPGKILGSLQFDLNFPYSLSMRTEQAVY